MSNPQPPPFDPFAEPQISPRPANIRWKLKGSSDGPIYRGSDLVKPCVGCGQREFVPPPPKPFTRHAPRSERAVVWPWLSTAARWVELRYSIRSVQEHFADKGCPFYVLTDAPPAWKDEFPRVEWITMKGYKHSREMGLFQAFELGMQIADSVLWMNDDIYLLRDQDWQDFDVALTEGDLTHKGPSLLRSGNVWQQGLGGAVETLKLLGRNQVWRFATHTPYLFEREKSLEIFETFHLPYKGGWVTLYHNWHRTPHQPCGRTKVNRLPTYDPMARFLNHSAAMPDSATRADLIRRFGQ